MKIIEILIAMILIYAILSILVSVISEWWSSRQKTRGNILRNAIFQMLEDPLNLNYGYLLTKHPLVNSMNNRAENRPFQYLDSGVFADALIDVIGNQIDESISVDQNANATNSYSANNTSIVNFFKNGIDEMNESPLQKMLLSLYLKSDGSYEKLKKSIESWYDNNMDRVSGWYKRKKGNNILWISFMVVLLLNVDSIHIFRVLSLDESLRKNLNVFADSVVEKYNKQDTIRYETAIQLKVIKTSLTNINITKDSITQKTLDSSINSFNSLANQLKLTDSTLQIYLHQANNILTISSHIRVPIGYGKNTAPFSWFKLNRKDEKLDNTANKLDKYLTKRNLFPDCLDVVSWLLGLLISCIMLCQGAPFWFELLVKFVNIRKAGIKPSK